MFRSLLNVMAGLLTLNAFARPVPGFFAAIAYSRSANWLGWSGNQHGLLMDAQAEALQRCGYADCFVVASVHNGCVAVATGEGRSYGWGTSRWRSSAQARAVEECELRTTGCMLSATVCTYGY